MSTTSRPARIAAALIATALLTSPIFAQAGEPAPTPVPAAAPAAAAPAAPEQDTPSLQGARFSGKRLVLEILAGAVVGSLAAYGTYSAMCSDDPDDDCFGPAIVASLVGWAVTPPTVWATGRGLGGKGTLGWTFLGGSAALGAFSAPGPADETPAETLARFQLQMTIATVAMPITSALLFELSSHIKFKQWEQAQAGGNLSVGITPVVDGEGAVEGAYGAMALRF